jgi:hypothetical protein
MSVPSYDWISLAKGVEPRDGWLLSLRITGFVLVIALCALLLAL